MQKVAAIQQTQRAVENAMTAVARYIKTNKAPTSEEARKIIEKTLQRLGCESPEGCIVAGGKLSAKPHAVGKGKLKIGEPIVIDIYPRNKKSGYFADMTRTVCLGRPSKELERMYNTVLGAQKLALSMVKSGVKGVTIQKAVEKYFEEKGYRRTRPRKGKKGWLGKEGFIHGVGHGVGKKIHEPPRIAHSADKLSEGDVVTIEPGLYYRKLGGIRIEDMVLVTKRGHSNLTHFTKKFVL